MRSAAITILFALLAVPARAQAPDARWEPWLGCWTLAAENLRDAQPQRGVALGQQPSTLDTARVCVTPSGGGARFETTVGAQTAIDQTIVADAAAHAVKDADCVGTQRAEWSKNGLRLFSSAEITCKGDPGLRRVSGLALIAPNGDWVDIQTVAIGDRETVRVKRYLRAPDSRRTARPTVVSSNLTLDEIAEASAKVPPAAVEAALIETNAGFDLTAKKVLALDSAGVSARVIDLVVALSYPEKFAIQRNAQMSPGGQSTYFRDPFLYGSSYYYDRYYGSPYYYEPFGYRGYAVVVLDAGGGFVGGGGGGGGSGSASGQGRVVNGLGYTRVVPRDRDGESSPVFSERATSTRTSSAPASADSSSSSSGSSSSGSSSGSSSSGSSSSGSSGGGSSSGSSSSGSSESGRTAVPR